MRWSVSLPVDDPTVGAADLVAFARAAEDVGVDAVHVTDHPCPPAKWLERGGHHASDPFVALSFAAAVTTRIQLHTNLLVAAHRNPMLAAKGISSLDALAGGRVIVGVGAGYMAAELEALGADFDSRAILVEPWVEAMRAAWTGEPFDAEGPGWRAEQSLMAPAPARWVPVWVGGNSAAAMRRAVAVGDGWMPFFTAPGQARATRTWSIESVPELRTRIVQLHEALEAAGRSPEGFDVCITSMTHPWGRDELEPRALAQEAGELEESGVTWMSARMPGSDPIGSLERFAEVLG